VFFLPCVSFYNPPCWLLCSISNNKACFFHKLLLSPQTPTYALINQVFSTTLTFFYPALKDLHCKEKMNVKNPASGWEEDVIRHDEDVGEKRQGCTASITRPRPYLHTCSLV